MPQVSTSVQGQSSSLSAQNASGAPAHPPHVPGHDGKIAPISVEDLIKRGRCARDTTTKAHFQAVLSNLNAPLSQERRTILRGQFDALLNIFKTRLQDVWNKDYPRLAEYNANHGHHVTYDYGSSWVQDEISPFESNVHLIYTYPPSKWPDWHHNSPTMHRMRTAGIDDIRKLLKCSFLHLHNHKHRTETRSDERDARPNTAEEEGPKRKKLYRQWPGDSSGLCHELEFQATYVIIERMKQHRPYAMLCFGEYGRDWFETYHDNGKFSAALGYEYRLEDLIWKISDSPDRYVEAKLFRPVDTHIKSTIVVTFPNSAAFVAHDINEDNDCVGKGLRLDAYMEILRSCFKVKATMSVKSLFTRHVQDRLVEKEEPAPYTWNLLHS